MMRRLASARWAFGALFCSLTLLACSVDEHKNPQRKTRAECKKLNGRSITDDYCLVPSSTQQPDAAVQDSGVVREGCTQEGETELCYDAEDKSTSQQPPCRAGSRTCKGGVWGECEKQVVPKAESCNGIDDDCDGDVDEKLEPSECEVANQQGECAKSTQLCLAGEFKCVQSSSPRAETCNGMDDDCDGRTDEGTQQRCYPDADGCTPSSTREGSYDCSGQCETGTRACVQGKYAQDCEGSVVPLPSESCTDPGGAAIDEDCDGNTDEGCTCKAGVTCYTGRPFETQMRAPCHAGTQACSDATHGTCQGEVTPKLEDCSNEGVDDDCDGMMDNVPARDSSCSYTSKAMGTCKASARWQCQDGKQVCVDGSPGTEVCDGEGADEDCDGLVDEGFDLQTNNNHCGACNRACGANLTCCAGSCVNTASSKAHCGKCGGACSGAETCCVGSCKNTSSDASNCGACGTVCPLLNSCTSGNCKLL